MESVQRVKEINHQPRNTYPAKLLYYSGVRGKYIFQQTKRASTTARRKI